MVTAAGSERTRGGGDHGGDLGAFGYLRTFFVPANGKLKQVTLLRIHSKSVSDAARWRTRPRPPLLCRSLA